MPDPDFLLTIAQLNAIVGDVRANTLKIREIYLAAAERGADLVVTPELGVVGYPIEDLVCHPDLLAAARASLGVLAAATRGRRAALVAGLPLGGKAGVYNAAAVLAGGKVIHAVAKRHLPNYGVFDEKRTFIPGRLPHRPFVFKGVGIGLLICEDLWSPEVARELATNGADLLLSISASPFREDVYETRIHDVAGRRAAETGLPVVYVNTVGGQDEVVFDGGSFMLDAGGRRKFLMARWEEEVRDIGLAALPDPGPEDDMPDPLEEVWRVMMLSVRDYAAKTGFADVVLGLSGGIDSAVAAAVAGDALGPERVHAVRLPSRHTSDLSNDAAERMCRIWGFDMHTLSIEGVVAAAAASLGAEQSVAGLKPLTRENMQARARGYLLMTLSNDRGWLLLTTGNKSEIAVGYSTLYGDMCGGFNPLKDVYKTTIFALAAWRNRNRPAGLLGPEGVVVPEEIIARPPTAELAPGQKDEDSLPPYSVLDAILEEMVEKQSPMEEIVARGFAPAVVDKVYRMLLGAEYKRRQGAPGPKTTARAFARDRRIPIVNRFDPKMSGELEKMSGDGGAYAAALGKVE